MRSAFHGQLLELPGVGVDNFSDLTCQAYLLSHCHTDHTAGLYSPALLQHLRRGGVYVYMSQPSAAIVRHESGGGELMDYVRPLPIGTSTVAVRGAAWGGAPQAVAVTLLPAGHCWGSVMFLLRTPYHTLLYTGDCRLAENSVHKYAQLHHEDGTVVQIDALYVDTTFGASPHRVLPSRSDSVARALSLIQRWLSGGGWGGAGGAQRRVALHTSARYGYEFLFQRAQAALGQPVLVPRDVWPLYSQFPRQVRGVTDDPSATRVHLCRNRSHTKSHEACVGEHCAAHAYLYVHFSALKWTEYESGDDPVHVLQDGGAARLDVCFATHCSHTELQYLVRYLRPARVHGFPNQYEPAEPVEPAEPAERGDYLQDTNTVADSRSDRSDDMSECRERDSKCDIEDKLVDKETLRKIFFDFDD